MPSSSSPRPPTPEPTTCTSRAAAATGPRTRHRARTGGLTLPELARKATGLPVIANGGLHHSALARRVLDEGHADLLAIGTAALANPDLPRKLAAAAVLTPFDPAVLQPRATLENARRVRARP